MSNWALDKLLDNVTIQPIDGAECYINGGLISKATELQTGDRVILGKNHVFRFNNPLARELFSKRKILAIFMDNLICDFLQVAIENYRLERT